MLKKTLLSWSSGKDSAWALHVLRQQSEVEVVGLITTVNQLSGAVVSLYSSITQGLASIGAAGQ